MNNKVKTFFKNFSYTFISNIISVIIASLVIIVIPKVIGVEEYGYWQVYLFYSSYVGFLHFGWNDGIYLRYGGKHYDELDKNLFFSQFIMIVSLQLLLVFSIFFVSDYFLSDGNRIFILNMTAICMIIMNVRYMLLYVLQGTNRIKEYAQITLLDRISYFLLIIVFLFFGVNEFKLLIVADLIGKFISLLYSMYSCRDIVFKKITNFKLNIKEMKENIIVGSKLMFANIASKLVIGVVRFGIERSWSVVVFGQVSLTLSISNFLMTFINTLGLVMFPMLRRTNHQRLSSIYIMMRDFLMPILFLILILYYPIKSLLALWLPEYAESLIYMAILFPMLVYEGKMALLINTYLKTLRKENALLRLNIISLMISFLLTILSTMLLKNINAAVLSILIVLILRSILSELYLSKILKVTVYKDLLLEIILTILFIYLGWFIDSWFMILWFSIIYILYIVLKRKDIFDSIQLFKRMAKKTN